MNFAILFYRRAQQLAPPTPAPSVRLINLYQQLGATEAAISEIQLFGISSNDPERLHFSRGLAQYVQANYAQAIEEYKLVLSGHPDTQLLRYAYRCLGAAQLTMASGEVTSDKLEHSAAAAASYEKTVELGTKDPEIYRSLARAYTAAGLSSKAMTLLETAHNKMPRDADISDELAAVYSAEAIRLYQEGRENAARDSDALALLKRV
jgi:tetratricopeptide (TPR) repeat protein